IVQITPLDRRQMSTEGLLRELRHGQLVHRESLVWRGGNADWRPIARVDELQGELPPQAQQRAAWPGRSALPGGARRLPLLAAGAAAFLVGALTLYALAWAGAFEPGGHKGRSALAGERR
ncbi:MAG TPA: GYF domain-containing protein, partial [Polyangiaceae bacterium]|nr:GYF domain-containing protein [Polyangiaceae bacterium]